MQISIIFRIQLAPPPTLPVIQTSIPILDTLAKRKFPAVPASSLSQYPQIISNQSNPLNQSPIQHLCPNHQPYAAPASSLSQYQQIISNQSNHNQSPADLTTPHHQPYAAPASSHCLNQNQLIPTLH